MKSRKYIIITGGVLSGLGKGVCTASIGFLFSGTYKVLPIKLDGYLNSDPGTMNPIEHGEVFVLEDGCEVDMDFGHYERFLDYNAKEEHSITMGKIFHKIRQLEREGKYLGRTVQMIPHVTDLIQDEIITVADNEDVDLVLIEVGGTIGDMESELFIEALRQLERNVGKENIIYVHLTYVPVLYGVNEQKTKPSQQSINLLRQRGIWPKMIIARTSNYLTDNAKKKVVLFSNVDASNVLSAPDVDCIYTLPQIFNSQNMIEKLSKELLLKPPKLEKLQVWENFLSRKKERRIKIAIAGKYMQLEDSYASIVESLLHCEFNLGVKIEKLWIDTAESYGEEILKEVSGIIVPGGFGERGVLGKLKIIKYARENKIPFLGICYGLQLAVVEFLRDVCGVKDANSTEIDSKTKNPVITLLDEQKNIVKLGGTMRLGDCRAKLKKGIISSLYKERNMTEREDSFVVSERHRHRYEVNPNYIKVLEKNGLVISGKSVKRDLVEFIELPQKIHPYFVATQSHPELKSRLENPAPLFYGLVSAALKKARD